MLAVLIPLVAIGGGGALWYGYTQQQFYLGAASEHVAIFQGIPEPVFNLPLSHVVHTDDTRVADLPPYYHERVLETMPAASLTDAHATLDTLRAKAEQCIGVLAVNLVRGVGRAIRVAASGMVELDGSMAELDEASVLAIGAAAGRRMAVVASADSPGELVDLARPDVPLTDFAAALRAASAPLRPVELEAKSADGYPVHGWVFAPPTSGPHPVLLMIHGGPFSAYGPTFFDEAQVLAEAGYAVLMCNPRGSASYGEAHAAAIKHDFGNLDAADVLAFLDHALATVSGLDADRVGIMGGSYGGYLTAWLIANEHRFAAAIVERAYLDPKTFVGASDIGWYFPAAIHGEDVRSPLLVVDQVRTPTLVIHSENDLRCPLAVALRYYTELKQRGVDAELLVFPGENHELSRSGSPLHRKARFEHILRWWDRHLPVVSA